MLILPFLDKYICQIYCINLPHYFGQKSFTSYLPDIFCFKADTWQNFLNLFVGEKNFFISARYESNSLNKKMLFHFIPLYLADILCTYIMLIFIFLKRYICQIYCMNFLHIFKPKSFTSYLPDIFLLQGRYMEKKYWIYSLKEKSLHIHQICVENFHFFFLTRKRLYLPDVWSP